MMMMMMMMMRIARAYSQHPGRTWGGLSSQAILLMVMMMMMSMSMLSQ